jgi:hypothetical protein
MSYSEHDDFWGDESQHDGFWKERRKVLAARQGRHAARRRFARRPTVLGVLAGALAVAFGVSAVLGWLPAHSITPTPRLALADTGHRPGSEATASSTPSSTPSSMPSATVPPSRQPHVKAVSSRRPAARPIAESVEAPPPAAPPPAKAPAKAPAKPPAKPPVAAAPVTHQISGSVQCTTMAVEGVWIAAENGGSGWATWTAMSSASTARYSYSLPNGGSYAVHVGCGGSPAHWLTTPDSNVVAGTFNNFLCHDVAGQPAFDFCSHIN